MNDKDALIIFAKNPEMGKVKTRLAIDVGDEEALKIYKILLKISFAFTRDLNCKKYIYFTDSVDNSTFDSRYENKIQVDGDLGFKMRSALNDAFDSNFNKVIIIGTDSPELNKEIISNAFRSLEEVDLVLGPAIDGGYYLLGMKKRNDTLFTKIKWSTESVLKDTIEKITTDKLTYRLLEELIDVDTLEDLNKVKHLIF
ncbi:TIGR04282 family arsenosugar biosynthesis glycosyltransferase [soil metagenome]